MKNNRTFVAYEDVLGKSPGDFITHAVPQGQVVTVKLANRYYKAAYNVPKLGGILVEILSEIEQF